MTANSNLFSKHPNPIFIETGSYMGDGIQQALSAGFNKVYSIELSVGYFDHCEKRFEGDKRVALVGGDSGKILGDILKRVKEPVTFWLDGHWSHANTSRGDEDSPLMKELAHINAWREETGLKPTILIDDMRCWNEGTDFTRNDVIAMLTDFDLSFEDGHVPNDILVAKCK